MAMVNEMQLDAYEMGRVLDAAAKIDTVGPWPLLKMALSLGGIQIARLEQAGADARWGRVLRRWGSKHAMAK